MRLALINKVFSQSGGGAERYAVDFANTLAAQGHEIHLYGVVIEDVDESIHKHYLTMPRKPGFRKILGFAKNARKALEADCEKSGYDVVYALTQAFPADLYFMGGGAHRHWLRIRMPNPLWRFIRCCLNPTHFAQMWLEDQIFKADNVGMILANSHLIKRHALEYGNVAPERVAVVHNGVDRSVFNPEYAASVRAECRKEFGLADDDLALLFVAHNWPRKGLETIIRALGVLSGAAKRYKVLIAGKGKPAKFIKIAEEVGVDPSRLCFLGSLREPQKLYAAGDVFVLPTMYDPCAGVTVEAMACSVPAITSTSNGACELVEHGRNGYVLQDYSDYTTLADYLQLLCDDALRKEMSLAAAESVKERSFEQVVRETVAVFEQIAASKK